jgi:hypothetical protein
MRYSHVLTIRIVLAVLMLAAVVACVQHGSAVARPVVQPAVHPASHAGAFLHVRANADAAVQDGLTLESAFATIQEAFDRVQPGGTVVIHPGVYFEVPVLRTLGTAHAPITIRADAIAMDRVILTAADRAVREGHVVWTLEDDALGLYSIPFDHLPARLLYSGTDLLPFPTLDGLKTFTLLDGYPGPRHGFFYQANTKQLFVRLHAGGCYGDRDPNHHRMCASPSNAQGYAGTFIHRPEHANLLIESKGAAHVVISGITFETPGAAGVVSKGGAVEVRDCWFRGCRFGVFGAGRPEGIVVDHCDFHQFPAFDDMAEVIGLYRGTEIQAKDPIYWWHRKGIKHDNAVMKTYETGIAGGIGQGWRITGNRIHDAFEGISTWGISEAEKLDVSGNRFERLVDNAIETENHSKNVRIHHNDIIDVFEPISWQPLSGLPWPGPIFVYRNRFITTAAVAELWPWPVGCFKLGASNRNWEKHPQMADVPRSEVVVPDPGFLVYNNTIVFPHGYLLSLPMPADRELVNVHFFNNVLVVRGMAQRSSFMGSRLTFSANAVVAPDDQARASLMADPDGLVLGSVEDLRQQGAADGEMRIRSDSPLLGRGSLRFQEADVMTDIGAVAGGGSWSVADPGPRAAR